MKLHSRPYSGKGARDREKREASLLGPGAIQLCTLAKPRAWGLWTSLTDSPSFFRCKSRRRGIQVTMNIIMVVPASSPATPLWRSFRASLRRLSLYRGALGTLGETPKALSSLRSRGRQLPVIRKDRAYHAGLQGDGEKVSALPERTGKCLL